MKLLSLLAMLGFAAPAFADEVKFVLEEPSVRAANGYGLAWNDPKNPLRLRVGDDLLFTNNDKVGHIIHTDGTPFPHGDRKHPIAPGATVKIHVVKPHDPARDGLMYDHATGPDAGQLFWVVAE